MASFEAALNRTRCREFHGKKQERHAAMSTRRVLIPSPGTMESPAGGGSCGGTGPATLKWKTLSPIRVLRL